MLFNYKYSGSSSVSSSGNSVGMVFAPDVLREPTYFIGELANKLPFREAISALHDVVISDFKYRPKDRTEYKKWLESQEEVILAQAFAQSAGIEQKISALQTELSSLRKEKQHIMGPYYKAQREYFNYLYKRDYTAWLVLDPVITVHPDEIFFECFSKDESSYGKLSCSHNVFNTINEFQCGTTNIDYSAALYDEFQKIRDYKSTKLSIDPTGFQVKTTHENNFKEVKIDLPESWVRGFLQVSSAMNMDSVSFDLHPVDMANFLFILKRNKEKESPRYIEYILEPGKPIKARFAPWDYMVECPRSIYKGAEKKNIKIWGRRRLLALERLLSISGKITVHLLGSGMPSFYIADMGDMQFTLGLSGWSANDWSRMGNFDLLSTRQEVDGIAQQKVYTTLRENWFDTAEAIAERSGIDRKAVLSSLTSFTEAGKVIYDLNKKVYRIRELSREALPVDQLKFTNEFEKKAFDIIKHEGITNIEIVEKGVNTEIKGRVLDKYAAQVSINKDHRVVGGQCTCSYYYQNKMYKGPCEHIIALKHKGLARINN